MRRSGVSTLAAAAVLLVAADRDPLAGRVAGAPQRCVTARTNQGLTIWDERTIAYREGARRVFIARPVGPCAQMREGDALIVEVFGGQICRNDRFRVRAIGMTIPSAPCRLGDFIPYDLPENKK